MEVDLIKARSVWSNGEKANLHYDYEFYDHNGRLHNISIGGVLEMDGTVIGYLYLVNLEFFQSMHFRSLCTAYRYRDQKQHEQACWMFSNVFKYFSVLVGRQRDTKISLPEFALTPRAFEGFEFDEDNLVLDHIKLPKIPNSLDAEVFTRICKTTEDFRNALTSFINRVAFQDSSVNWRSKFSNEVQGWGYFSAHDHVALCNDLGGMLNAGERNLIYYTYDLRQIIDFFGLDHDKLQPVTPHHPLLDAIEQYKLYRKLKSIIKDQLEILE